jgi:predicted XRE-type DNA-binding protein
MNSIKKHQKNIIWEEGSDNVFADLDMPDSEEKLIKAKLAFKINEIIAKKKLKQTQAAKLLGVDQSKISLLACGHLTVFSVERLAHYLTLLHQDVDIVIRKTKNVSGYGKLSVVYV